MVKRVYAIRISGMAYEILFLASNDAEAKRQFYLIAYEEEGIISQQPAEFDLFCVGSFDNEKASLKGFSPIHVANASEIMDRPSREHSHGRAQ